MTISKSINLFIYLSNSPLALCGLPPRPVSLRGPARYFSCSRDCASDRDFRFCFWNWSDFKTSIGPTSAAYIFSDWGCWHSSIPLIPHFHSWSMTFLFQKPISHQVALDPQHLTLI